MRRTDSERGDPNGIGAQERRVQERVVQGRVVHSGVVADTGCGLNRPRRKLAVA